MRNEEEKREKENEKRKGKNENQNPFFFFFFFFLLLFFFFISSRAYFLWSFFGYTKKTVSRLSRSYPLLFTTKMSMLSQFGDL